MANGRITIKTRIAPNYFDDSDISSSINESIVRGSAFLIGASGGKFVMNFISTVILARLLDPEAYGLLAMVFVVSNFVTLFRDMNMTLATVQKEKITHAQISTIFWVNAAVSCAITLVLIALAPGIAWFYGDPRLTGIAMLLAVPVFIRGLVVQHKALLRRKMYFGTLTAMDLGCSLVGYVTAVVMAWQGYGYWSLIGMHVSTAIADFTATLCVTRWRPGLPVRGSGARGMVIFGVKLTGYSIIRYASRSLDNALIGWYSGPAALGIYSKSRDVTGQIINYAQSPFNAVGVPSLSRLTQQPERYRRTFQRLTEKIVLISLVASVLMACTAGETIQILLGPKWTAAEPVLTILAIMVYTEAVFACVNWLFISQGRGGQLFKYGIFDAGSRVIAVLAGFPWGMLGIIGALGLLAFIRMPVQIWYACRQGPVRQSDVYGMLAPMLGAAAVGLAVVLAVRRAYPIEQPAVAIAVAAAALMLTMFLVLLLMPPGRRLLLDLIQGARMLVLRRRSNA